MAPPSRIESAPKRVRSKGTVVGCKCGNEDKALFMLSCDDCGKWFHGACVGVEEDAAHSAEHWACRTCAAAEARRQEKAEARRARYCVCRAPWDGKSFMIECNGCGEWYHGACVGLNIATTTEATEAAFKKWNCPFCVTGGLLAATAAPSGGRVYGRGRSRGRRAQPSSEPPSPVTPATPATPAAPSTSTPSLLDALTDDCVALVVAALPLPSVLLSFVPLSRRCAELAEAPIRAFCVAQRWQVPRRAQGRPFAWRQLLRSRACAVCLAATAPFPARRGDAIAFRLCKGARGATSSRTRRGGTTSRSTRSARTARRSTRSSFARLFTAPPMGSRANSNACYQSTASPPPARPSTR